MTTKHLVDPELVAILDMIPATAPSAENLSQIRAMSSRTPVDLPQFSTLSVSERFIPGPEAAPDVRVLICMPPATENTLPVLLWLHGGGYIMGSADGEDLMAKTIVSAVGCAVISVDTKVLAIRSSPSAEPII